MGGGQRGWPPLLPPQSRRPRRQAALRAEGATEVVVPKAVAPTESISCEPRWRAEDQAAEDQAADPGEEALRRPKESVRIGEDNETYFGFHRLTFQHNKRGHDAPPVHTLPPPSPPPPRRCEWHTPRKPTSTHQPHEGPKHERRGLPPSGDSARRGSASKLVYGKCKLLMRDTPFQSCTPL